MLELSADLVISCIIKIIFHLTGAAHRIHQKSKYWKTHQNQRTWNTSSWIGGTHKTASASKNQNVIILSKKCSRRLEKKVHQSGAVKHTQKNMGHTGSKEEPKSMKFAKPKCSSCKQNEIRSHREIIFLHMGRLNITFMKNQSTV